DEQRQPDEPQRPEQQESEHDPPGDRQSLPCAGQNRHYLSTPPMIGSREAITAIVSAIRWPGMSSPTDCRWMNDGSWIRSRNGWSVPSLIAYVAYCPRGPSIAA